MQTLTIGKLSKLTDVKIPTIRFYEQIGLLPEPARSDSDRRIYEAEAVRRLTFIKHARQLGFPVEAIRSLLTLSDNPRTPCEAANELAASQLAAVEQRLQRLERLRTELKRIVDEACHGQVSNCRVFEILQDDTFDWAG